MQNEVYLPSIFDILWSWWLDELALTNVTFRGLHTGLKVF